MIDLEFLVPQPQSQRTTSSKSAKFLGRIASCSSGPTKCLLAAQQGTRVRRASFGEKKLRRENTGGGANVLQDVVVMSWNYYFAVTSECVIACTDNAIRFCTPTFRMSLATWAFTVRSSMPSAAPISLLERPATSISRTSFSRSVNVTRPAGKMRPGEVLTRSINMESTWRGAQTEP